MDYMELFRFPHNPWGFSWGEFLDRLMPDSNGVPPKLTPVDLRRCICFWRLYPRLRNGRYPNDDALVRLFAFHLNVEFLILAAAEGRGLDSSCIAESGRLCREILETYPDLAEESPEWPIRGLLQNPTLSEQNKRSISQADMALSRLHSMLLAESMAKSKSQGPLTETQENVFRIIRDEGPIQGAKICSRTGIEQSTLTKHIIPVLKDQRGVRNKPGAGYYLPSTPAT